MKMKRKSYRGAFQRERGGKIVDCSITCNLWRDDLDGLKADRVFLHDLEKYGTSIGRGYKERDRGETEHLQFLLWLHLNSSIDHQSIWERILGVDR